MAGLICRNATFAVTLGRTEDRDLYLEFIVILVAHLSAYAALYPSYNSKYNAFLVLNDRYIK